ncbi:hypothetical protein CPB83DRAFT_908151 [Crepidotus variabilis]|uniref:Zn(2)-C6 fungal-type domain-containing protein n=1 Tax=Crepidotus variabilis TaxID=179855 RepID=A0A9P6ED09_9AGAR|nr:hypothetical protein CPB83DRAFT_908151 [Crepidotus variabilis]
MSFNNYPAAAHMYPHNDLDYGQQSMHCPPPTNYASSGDRYAGSNTLETPSTLYSDPSSHIHPHPLFTRADDGSIRPLEPHHLNNPRQVYQNSSSLTHFPQGNQSTHPFQSHVESWPLQNVSLSPNHQANVSISYSLPSPAPFPPAQLTPPLRPLHQKLVSHNSQNTTTGNRPTLAGSLDPATGIFYRTPEHPRLRTAQACEKCRTRKAKCSGEHPFCKRCLTRGLVCEYAKEGRVRGPNKPKTRSGSNILNGHNVSNDQGVRDSSLSRTSSNPTLSSASSLPDLSPTVRRALAVADSRMTGNITGRRTFPTNGCMPMRHRPQGLQLNAVGDVYGDAPPGQISSSFETSKTHTLGGGDGLMRLEHYDLRGNSLNAPACRDVLDVQCFPPMSVRRARPDPPFVQAHEVDMVHNSTVIHYQNNSLYAEAQFLDQQSGHSDEEKNASATSLPIRTNCGSPLTCESGTTSSMGSPLTPASSSSTQSALTGQGPENSSQFQFAAEKPNEPNGVDLDFHIHPSLMSSNTPHNRVTPEPEYISGDHSPLRGQGGVGPYQPDMEIQLC